jgi:hypothetical protein
MAVKGVIILLSFLPLVPLVALVATAVPVPVQGRAPSVEMASRATILR